MKQVKPFVISFLYKLHFLDLILKLHRNKVIILMYHRFSDRPEPFKIQRDVFERQIRFLKKKFMFISLSHYAEVLAGERNDIPPNPVILTIDDGYWDNYIYAYPILKKYSVPATIFIGTDFITEKAWLWSNKLEFILKNSKYSEFEFPLGHETVRFHVGNFESWHRTQLTMFNYCRSISDSQKDEVFDQLAKHLKVSVPDETQGDFQPLTWEQIREMYGNGVDFGSHTCSHAILSRLNDDELKYEIVQSKSRIEENISSPIDFFCYPNGTPDDFDVRAVKLLEEASYAAAVTTVPGYNYTANQDPFQLKRDSIPSDIPEDILRRLVRP